MSNEAELQTAAAGRLDGEHVLAAGIFGLADDALTLTAAGAAGAALADPAGPLGAGAVAGVSVAAGRELHARQEGLTVRMLVAVTDDLIVVFALGAAGHEPERELLRWPRATTAVTVTKKGLSRRVTLEDPGSGQSLHLTGAVAGLSSTVAGDKAVLALLS